MLEPRRDLSDAGGFRWRVEVLRGLPGSLDLVRTGLIKGDGPAMAA